MKSMQLLLLLGALVVLSPLAAQSTSGALAINDDTFTHPGGALPGSAGGPRRYEAIQFNVITTGTYTFTYTCTGYTGAMFPYQGSFQPGSPITNYWGNGTSGGSPTVVTTNLSVTGQFTILLTSTANNATGTWTLSISGAGTLEMGPVIRNCNPGSGSTGGGTNVTLDGDFFTGVTSVSFGGGAVTNLSVVNDTTITCTTPSHAAGAVNIAVSKPAGFGLNGTLFNGFTYNLTPTSVASINRQTPTGADTNATSVVFRVTFAASIGSVTAGNFSVNATGVAGASVTGVTGGGTQWDVTVGTGTGDGTLRLDMVNDTGTSPTLTNLPFTTGQSYTIDKTAPAVVSITRVDTNPTTAANVDFLITFSETVSGVATANLNLTVVGVTGAAITNIAGAADTRTVTVSTGTNDGTIRLDVLNLTPPITDDAGNNVQSAFITGEEYTVDTAPPTLAISAPNPTSTSTGPVDFTIDYTGATNITLTAGDVTLNTTGTATGMINVSGTGNLARAVSITSITGDGTIGISIGAGTAVDGAANSAGAAGPSATFTVTAGAGPGPGPGSGGSGGGDDDGCAAGTGTGAWILLAVLLAGAMFAAGSRRYE
jgi:hypothetical protein